MVSVNNCFLTSEWDTEFDKRQILNFQTNKKSNPIYNRIIGFFISLQKSILYIYLAKLCNDFQNPVEFQNPVQERSIFKQSTHMIIAEILKTSS